MLDTVIRDMEPQLRILAGGRELELSIEPEVNLFALHTEIQMGFD